MCTKLLCVWGPGSREMREFCLPELQELYSKECSGSRTATTAEPETLSVSWLHDGTDTRLAWVSCSEPDALQRAAASSATLLALVEVVADAPTLDAAAAQAAGRRPADWSHPLAAMRTLVLGSPHSKSSAERHLLRQLQQRLAERSEAIGGTAGNSAGPACNSSSGNSGTAVPSTLWALELQHQGLLGGTASPADTSVCGACSAWVLLGVELARGGVKVAGRRRGGCASGGPTQMKPELALATANLAALPRDAVVLDPFCGTGTLLEAAAECGAAFVLGSDMEPALGGLGAATAADALAADASCLRLRPGCLDAILCDLPYGYRAAAVVEPAAGANSDGRSGDGIGDGGHQPDQPPADGQLLCLTSGASPAWLRLLEKLLQLGGYSLSPGGRLVVWMPHTQPDAAGSQLAGFRTCSESGATVPAGKTGVGDGSAGCSSDGEKIGKRDAGCSWLGELAGGQGLQLRHYLPETRQGGFPRAVAVLQKGPMPPAARQTSRGRAARAATAQVGMQQSSCIGKQLTEQQRGKAGAADQGHAQITAALQTGDATCEGARGERHREARAAAAGCTEPDGTGSRRAAILLRGLRYSQARLALQGRDIDVWRASWLGDTAAVRSYLEAGGPVDAQDAKGQTALQFASGYGKAAVVELLLLAGADASLAQDKGQMAPLHRAASRGHTSVVSLLLRHGADPRQRSAAGQTPLMHAAQFGHRAALAALLQPLEVSMQGSGEASVSSMEVGPSNSGGGSSWDLSGLQDYISMTDGQGLSALHLAAQWGMADIVQDLVLGPGWELQGGSCSAREVCNQAAQEAGSGAADSNTSGGNSASPSLPSAAPVQQLHDHMAVVLPTDAPLSPPCRLADPNYRPAGGEGLAPAHLAARWGHVGVLRTLWALGADLQLTCLSKGRTPLQEAREWSRPACASFLESCQGQGQG